MQITQFPEEAVNTMKAFAKAKRAGLGTVEALVRQVLNSIPEPTVPEANSNKPPRKERQSSDKSQDFRAAVLENLDSLKGQEWTFKQLAQKFGIDAPNCQNNILWLQKNNKLNFKIVGQAPKPAGERGKRANLIAFE